MKPFFSFFGSKWRVALRYPQPRFDRIIEPFAGSAGYSLRHFSKSVLLIEKDPVIAALWKYLIKAKSKDIRALPLIRHNTSKTIHDLDVSPEAKSLIGFWLNKGNGAPCCVPSAWMRTGLYPTQFWGVEIRERVASQVEAIKHWSIVNGDYCDLRNEKATWFVDPPYQITGTYRFGNKQIDYDHLSDWCQRRKGQVVVCENNGSKWLPFKPFIVIKGNKGVGRSGISKEAIWLNASRST